MSYSLPVLRVAVVRGTLLFQRQSSCFADYLLVIVVAIVLTGANVVGYTKCSKQASAQVRSMARNAMTAGLTVSLQATP